MDCKDVKENLSAYIDDMLDKQIKILVDQHLAECKSCRQELSSMLSVVEELKDTGGLKAPEDFLESLHDRLSAASYWERIKEILFVPAQIKIPLEFAAISIVAVLMFTLYSVYSPQDQMIELMKDAPMEISGAGPVVHEEEPGRPDAILNPDVASDVDYVEAAKQPSLDIALVLKEEVAAATGGPAKDKGKTQATAARAFSEKQGRVAAPSRYKASSPGTALPLEESPEVADALKEDTQESVIQKRSELLDKKLAFYNDHESVRRILDLVGLAGGRVLSEELDNTGRQDFIILAEIPYEQYHEFFLKLTGIAELKGPVPVVRDVHGDTILVSMRLMQE